MAGPLQASASMQMHRAGAGQLDTSGWTDAVSTEGAFAVRLPVLFNDFSVTDNNPTAAVAKTDVIGGKRSDGVKFLATRIDYRAGAPVAQGYFAQFAGMKTLGGTPVNVRKVTGLPFPTYDIEVNNTNNFALERVMLIGPSLLMLQVEGPAASLATVRSAAATFFASARVTAAVSKRAAASPPGAANSGHTPAAPVAAPAAAHAAVHAATH